MFKKITFFLFYLFISTINLHAQIYPYKPVKFSNLEPIWIHESIDSTIIDNEKYDGKNHFSIVNDIPLPHLINDKYLFIATNTQIATKIETEGALIEKINLKTGRSVWVKHFDLRNNNRLEFVEAIYFNDNDNIEIITDRTIKLNTKTVRITYGDTALLCIRQYDINTGDLVNHSYPDTMDLLSHRIRFSTQNKTILYPLKNRTFQYLWHDRKSMSYNQYNLDENGHLLQDKLTDSITFEEIINPDSVSQGGTFKLIKISEDSLITLDYVFNNDNPLLDKQTKLTLYNKNLEKKRVFKIDSLIYKNSQNLQLINANHDFIYLSGKFIENDFFTDTFFYSIFNWEGKLEAQFTTIYDGKNHSNFKIVHLEKDKKFLVVSVANDLSGIDFLLTTDEGKLDLIKEYKFDNEYVFSPSFMTQLENGDILLKGNQKIKIENSWRGFWPIWIRIKAKDIGLKTSNMNLAEFEKKNLITYPNPVKNILKVEFESRLMSTFKIIDEMGRIVLTFKMRNEFAKDIDVSRFSKGVYFIMDAKSVNKNQIGTFIKSE